MGTVTRLYHCEEVVLDRDCLGALAADLGRVGAERVIDRAMEEIAVRLTRIENALNDCDLMQVEKCAQSLVAIADQTGMTTVKEICGTVVDACQCRDSTALGACVARLIRVGEMSLVTIWDVHDLSM